MNSINKLCQSINNKLDILVEKVDTIEKKIESLENKINKTTEKKIQKDKIISLSKKSKIVKSGSITIKEYNDCILICGETYDKKVTIKKCKGLWNPENKGWIIKNKKYKDTLLKSLRKITKNVEHITIGETFLSTSDTEHSDEHEQETFSSSISFIDDD
jgi:hypothetical protein|tara:strand:- start:788 stop:1264 length:477 start_codon:yes stop_codon:yes gene_type:complete